MYKIARAYDISQNLLTAANPHIPRPGLIIPGDILCVPKSEYISLRPVADLPKWVNGAAYLSDSPLEGLKSLTVVANLPAPETIGDYVAYRLFIVYDNPEGFTGHIMPMHPTQHKQPTFSTRIDMYPHMAEMLTPSAEIYISAVKFTEGVTHPGHRKVLEGKFTLAQD
ncbi:MAG: LysM peptidoglycan-binding domain-containing protein [Bacillota bacterium]